MSKKLVQIIAERRIADGTIKPLPLQEQVTGLYDFCCDLLDVLSSGERVWKQPNTYKGKANRFRPLKL